MKDMNARDFGWKFNGEFSVRLFHTLVQRPISEFSLKEIQQKDFLDKPNIGIKTWNEFVEIRNLYFNNWKKKKTNTKKTAMQELIDELKLIEAYPMSPLVLKMATDLLEKEKEQIKKAYKDHHDLGHIFGLDTEQYFNQTYNN
jgi:hypothetical protein